MQKFSGSPFCMSGMAWGDYSPLGFAGNAVGTFLSLAFREYTRAYGIVNIYWLRKRGGVVESLFRVCFTLLLALTEIPLNRSFLV